jgi:hypothetical protein
MRIVLDKCHRKQDNGEKGKKLTRNRDISKQS